MTRFPERPNASHRQEVLETLARNLGIRLEDLLSDPEFRKNIGAEELDRLEAVFHREARERNNG